jgi:hypothetical protein
LLQRVGMSQDNLENHQEKNVSISTSLYLLLVPYKWVILVFVIIMSSIFPIISGVFLVETMTLLIIFLIEKADYKFEKINLLFFVFLYPNLISITFLNSIIFRQNFSKEQSQNFIILIKTYYILNSLNEIYTLITSFFIQQKKG